MEEKGNNNSTGRPTKSGDSSNIGNEYAKLYQNYNELKRKLAQDYLMFKTQQEKSMETFNQLEKMYEEKINELIEENVEKNKQIIIN